jgi:predicted TIM-barrel fold metal-dependent hydrolase
MPNVRRTNWKLAPIIALTAMACRDGAPATRAERPRFPVIDIHTHLGGVERWPGERPNFREIAATMDSLNVELVVDFKAPDHSLENGVFGDRVAERIAMYPDTSRFKLFANVPIDDKDNAFLGSRRADYPTWIAGVLEDAVRRGAAGLKIKDQAGESKETNYWTRDTAGNLVAFDSPAFDPLWSTAERLGVPVLVHLGGAYKGEHQSPNGPNRAVRWELLMLQRERVLRKHPRLKYIGAHWASATGDRTYLEEVLEKYPNMVAEGGAHDAGDEYAELDAAELAFFERYQDQLLFGSDYMENTFSWLKSYRQRLDMFLPYSAAWPIADSVKQKYYHGNARRLLRRSAPNRTPLAHPGFTSTHLVGANVVLDGTASIGGTTTLRYQWRQTDGAAVRIATDSAGRARFTAPRTASELAFELVVRSDSAQSRPRSVRVNVVDESGMFDADSGRVVIEAEHFTRAIERGGGSWKIDSTRAGFAGSGYVVAGAASPAPVQHGRFRATTPELQYTFSVNEPGTYVVYARGMAPDTASTSLHFGLDNEEARLADRVGNLAVGQWGWIRHALEWDAQFNRTDTTLAVLNVAEPGPHVLNVWMDRPGVMLDRIVLVRAEHAEVSKALFDPGPATGPAESRRRALRR